MVRARPHDDEGATVGAFRVAGELARDPRHAGGVDPRVLLLPGRGVRLRILVVDGPVAGKLATAHAELGSEKVEHRRDEMAADPSRRDAATVRASALGVADVEARQLDLDELVMAWQKGECRLGVLELEVPLSHPLLAPAEPDRSVRDYWLASPLVDEHGLPLGVLARVAEVRRAQEAVRDPRVSSLAQRHEERQVGVLARVAIEVRDSPVDVELLQDHVTHRHREGAVGARRRGEPVVGELRVAGEVRRHDHDLLAPIASLGHEVRVGRPRLRDVRAPEDRVARVPPVGRLGHVGLITPDLRRGGRQVRVPVVEGEANATDQRQEPRSRGVRHHRHRRNRREAHDAVGPVAPDRVDVRGRDEVGDLVPRRADEASLAALLLVAARLLGILDHVGPRLHRIAGSSERLPVEVEQGAAHVRVPDAERRVDVPAERCSTRAPARLVLGDVGAVGRDSRSAGSPRRRSRP